MAARAAHDPLSRHAESARTGRRELWRVVTPEGTVVCERCERAETMFARMRGLLGRDRLEPGGGMLINPAPSVHMFFMRFPIDVVFLDRSKTVVKVVHELRPWRAAAARHAVAALELPAGTIARVGIVEGQTLSLEPAEEPDA